MDITALTESIRNVLATTSAAIGIGVPVITAIGFGIALIKFGMWLRRNRY